MSEPNGNVLVHRVGVVEHRIDKLDERVDDLCERLTAVEQTMKPIVDGQKRLEAKLDSVNAWLRGVLGSLVLALLLLIADLLRKS